MISDVRGTAASRRPAARDDCRDAIPERGASSWRAPAHRPPPDTGEESFTSGGAVTSRTAARENSFTAMMAT
jgi:hypothetical protein